VAKPMIPAPAIVTSGGALMAETGSGALS